MSRGWRRGDVLSRNMDHGSPRILVLDANLDLFCSLAEVIRNSGFSVRVVRSDQALREFEEGFAPDAIVVRLVNGYGKAAELLRFRSRHLGLGRRARDVGERSSQLVARCSFEEKEIEPGVHRALAVLVPAAAGERDDARTR